MPHLTPMSWIMAMFMVWTLISFININSWSNKPMKFTKLSNKMNKSNQLWSWYMSWPKIKQ